LVMSLLNQFILNKKNLLETRQLNRRHYESYVCRRIIGKQAVVVLGCDNRHMDQLMSKNMIEYFLVKKNRISSFFLV
jgi:hypothetical protein